MEHSYSDFCDILGLHEAPPMSYGSGSGRQFKDIPGFTDMVETENFSISWPCKQSPHEDTSEDISEDNLYDPRELFDFLSTSGTNANEELDCLNNLDFDFHMKDLSEENQQHPQGSGDCIQSCDLIDNESDSGIESLNSVSPQYSPAGPSTSPLPSTQFHPDNDTLCTSKFHLNLQNTSLPLSSIRALLPDKPLDIRDLGIKSPSAESSIPSLPSLPSSTPSLSSSTVTGSYNSIMPLPQFLESNELMTAVPPQILIKKDTNETKVPTKNNIKSDIIKKPQSLLSCLLSIPPVETKSAKQLSSLLSQERIKHLHHTQTPVSPVDTIVNFINSSKSVSVAPGVIFDSFQQKDNDSSRCGADLGSVPSLETEIMGPEFNIDMDGETHPRKKLIINKRKKEPIHMTVRSRVETSATCTASPWDGDLRVTTTPHLNTRERETGVNSPSDVKNKIKSKTSSSNNKTYLCPTCGATFASTAARSCHRRQIHQRHHLCVTCDKAFTTSQKLERHLRTHKSDKKHKCEVCRKEFSLEENLESHYNVHFALKLFKCEHCQNEFFTQTGLNTHQKQLHGETHHRCSTCEFVARTSLELEIHTETDHTKSLITSNESFYPHYLDNSGILLNNSPQLTPLSTGTVDGADCFLTCDWSEASNPSLSLVDKTAQTTPSAGQVMENSNSRPADSGAQLEILEPQLISRKHTCKHCGHKFAFKNSLTKHLSKGRCVILKKSLQQNLKIVVG